MYLKELVDNKSWETALITFCSSNWKNLSFTEEERTYRVSKNNRYFQDGKISNSLFGDCLDGKDLGVRLDAYKWKVEKIQIEE